MFEKNFYISIEEFKVIMKALAELPFKEAALVINSLQEQAIQLDKGPVKTEE